MPDYKNPIDGREYTDKQHVETALYEYRSMYVGKQYDVKGGDYLGTVSQIYDNVHGNEEQVYVLTNNGTNRAAVPYSASDTERAQVQDVTVMMQGSQTKTDTPKLLHDTVTDWLPTDFVTATHRLGPVGAAEHAAPFVYRHTKDLVTQNTRKGMDQVEQVGRDALGNIIGVFNKEAGQSVTRTLNEFSKNTLNEWSKDLLSNAVGIVSAGAVTDASLKPIMLTAGGLKLTHKFPPAQFEDAAKHLKETIRKYPNAKIDLYGHSLGSMDIQYALASLTEEEMRHIGTVHIYNGPNIYPLLTKEQKARLDSAKYKIFNHIDHNDIVSLGYSLSGSENAAGIVRHIKTTGKSIDDQHMMKGYIYDKNKNFVLMDGTGKITIQDTIKANMIPYQNMKKYLSKGGFSGNEKIYLDSVQAQATAQNLVNVAKLGYETLQQARDQVVGEAETLAEELHKVPWGFSLSPDEMAAAYLDGGADYQSLVTSLKAHFDNRLSKVQALQTTFTALTEQLSAGIQQLLDKDQVLAGDFEQWNQIKQ